MANRRRPSKAWAYYTFVRGPEADGARRVVVDIQFRPRPPEQLRRLKPCLVVEAASFEDALEAYWEEFGYEDLVLARHVGAA